MRGFDQSRFARPARARKGPFLIAEQLTFQQTFRQRAAVDCYERMVTTRTGVVHALRQQFLADPAWPGDQHRRLPARGIDAAPTNHGLHRRRRLHDLVQRMARARALAAVV
ncbi:hypothetical protein G6F45_013927 [Rhizopus arrhizus]|nr:hypothetical protein G6F45_013927 [Rhizopus arrhizus]